jgi:Carboxypeptidase regulatory-like domain
MTRAATVILSVACLLPASLFAQPVRDASLLVTVLDQTRGVLAGATVTVAGTEPSNKTAVFAPAPTSQQGQVTFERLTPGRYSITAEFSGFQTQTLPDVRIRSGENKQLIVLPLERLQSSITVERDRQQAASDRDVTFGTVLTREQIDALSDDPDELRRQLLDIAGPGATLLVDSFEGRDLPPKALIKSIRVTRDAFAAEVHFAGDLRIEVLTQPGMGPVRGNLRSGFYDSVMDGKNPLVNQTGPAQSWMYGVGLNGTLINERASFNVNFNGQDSYSTPVIYAATPIGQVTTTTPLRSPADNYFYNGGIDYALTRDQVLRVNLQGSRFTRGNLGVGSQDLVGRSYSSEDRQFGLFVQQNGPIGRRFVLNTRFSMFGNDSEARSALEEMTIVVNDAFTSGGAQRRGGTHARNYWFNSDLDYVRGIHSMRAGVEVQVGRFNTDSESNYLGTYVFESLDAFDARRARSYTRRIGDPSVKYSNVQSGLYIQDDIKVRKGLTITGGVRYEAQTHVPDALNFAPRVGFTWAPFKSGKTTLRGSWGIFYDWLPTGTYVQTLQVDGFRQREINIVDPSFPDPGDVGSTPPTNRYLLAEERDMAYSQRLSAGIAQTISRRLSTNVLYSYSFRYALLTGRNVNTPVNGVRPDPEFANVVLARSDGWGRQHTMNASVNLDMGPLPPTGGPSAAGGAVIMAGGGGPIMILTAPGAGAAGTGPRFMWNRGLSFSGFYAYGQSFDNTDGAFVIPATIVLADEWGPAALDRRHTMYAVLTSTALRNFSARLSINGSSALPLNVRTGTDDNGDLVFNDRPAGVGRNSARTMGT